MIYLILCILFSTLIFINFRLIETFKQKIFPIIVINYIVAFLFGLTLSANIETQSEDLISWLPYALILGIMFISMFYTIGYTTKIKGITITTIASKMSVIIPIVVSVILYNEKLNSLQFIGIVIALLSIFLIIYKPEVTLKNNKGIYLPIIVFIGTGIIDSYVKFTEQKFLSTNDTIPFTSVVFFISTIIGISMIILKKSIKELFPLKTVILGISLGLLNFGSLYFLIRSFQSEFTESSIIFGLNNLGIVALSVIIAVLFFREKLNFLNILGIILSLSAIILLTFTS